MANKTTEAGEMLAKADNPKLPRIPAFPRTIAKSGTRGAYSIANGKKNGSNKKMVRGGY